MLILTGERSSFRAGEDVGGWGREKWGRQVGRKGGSSKSGIGERLAVGLTDGRREGLRVGAFVQGRVELGVSPSTISKGSIYHIQDKYTYICWFPAR
jgi:hypothetical protein